jgi:hypothetical protein
MNRLFDTALAVFAGTQPGRSRSRFFRDFLAWTMGDLLGVHCGQQGSMQSHTLARGMAELIRAWFGFHGCCTSLLYWALRFQSGVPTSGSVRDFHGDHAAMG